MHHDGGFYMAIMQWLMARHIAKAREVVVEEDGGENISVKCEFSLFLSQKMSE